MKTTFITWDACVRAGMSAAIIGILGAAFSRNAMAESSFDAPAAVTHQPATSSTGLTASATMPATPANTDLLDNIILSANQIYDNLVSFVCREEIERYKGNGHNPSGQKLDVITSTVSYGGDAEHYSDILQNNKPLDKIRGLTGAWSEGEYGTLLGETLKALKSKPVKFVSYTTLEGARAAVYAFEYTADDSPWEIEIAGRHYFLPFHGQIWASTETGSVLRIVRVVDDMPRQTGIAGVNWAVDFKAQPADGKMFWLPSKAVYSVSYLDSKRHEWNVIAFSGYKRYGSEVVVRFQ